MFDPQYHMSQARWHCNPSTLEVDKEDQKFKVILSDTGHLKPG